MVSRLTIPSFQNTKQKKLFEKTKPLHFFVLKTVVLKSAANLLVYSSSPNGSLLVDHLSCKQTNSLKYEPH